MRLQVRLVDQFRYGLRVDYLDLRRRDFLCHKHSVVTKKANALANAQYPDQRQTDREKLELTADLIP